MKTYKLYLANSHGKALSGFTNVEAVDLKSARDEYRRIHAGKKISWEHCEILAAH